MNVSPPDILAAAVTPPTALYRLDLPGTLEVFQGHFPGRPILPGVVQVHWAVLLAGRSFGHPGAFRGIEALKFHRVIGPGMPVQLALERRDGETTLRFSYRSDTGLHSQGRILFG